MEKGNKRGRIYKTILVLIIVGYFLISFCQGKSTYSAIEIAKIRETILEYKIKEIYDSKPSSAEGIISIDTIIENDSFATKAIWKMDNILVKAYVDGTFLAINKRGATLSFQSYFDQVPIERAGGIWYNLKENLDYIVTVLAMYLILGMCLPIMKDKKSLVDILCEMEPDLEEEDLEELEDELEDIDKNEKKESKES